MSDGKIVIETTIDNSEVTSQLKNLSAETQKSMSKTGKSMLSLGNIAKIALGGAVAKGVKELTTAGVKYNAEMETNKNALTTLLGSAQKAQKAMSAIQTDALKTPFDVAGLTKGNQLLISTGISAEQARKDMLNLGNAVVATGGGNDELMRMAQNLQQVKTQGKASAMDVKQFAMAGINIYPLLAKSMGKTVDQIKDMDITYEDLTKALAMAAKEGGAYANALETQSDSLAIKLSNLGESVQVFAGTLTSGLSGGLKTLMDFVTDTMNQLSTAFQNGGFAEMGKVGVNIINNILKGFSQSAPKMTAKAGEAIGNFIKGLTANGPSLIQNGIQAISSFVSGISQQLPTLVPMAVNMILTLAQAFVSNIPQLWDAGLKIIEGLATGIINSIPMLIQKVPLIINTFAANFDTNLIKFLALGAKLIGKLALGLIKAIPLIIQNAGQILLAILNVFQLSKMINLGQSLIKSIGKGLKSLGSWLSSTLKSLGNKAWTNFKNINWIQAGKSALTSITNGLKSLGSKLWEAVKTLAKKAVEKFKEVDWLQLGKDIVLGIIKGIGSMAGGVFTKLKDLAKNALGSAKKEIDSHSPSKKFRDEVGVPIVQGIMVGIAKMKNNLSKDIQGLLSMPKEINTNIDAFSKVPNTSNLGYMKEQTSTLYQVTNSANIDYTLLAEMIVRAFANSNISVEINKRKIGRVIGG